MPSHLPPPEERYFKELFINLAHEREIDNKLALLADRLARVAWFDHAPSHFTPQGLSFRDKKSLATASSPILACGSFTCSLSTSGINGIGWQIPPSFADRISDAGYSKPASLAISAACVRFWAFSLRHSVRTCSLMVTS